MATDFWASSHYKRWIVDRATIAQARQEDLQYVDDPEHLEYLSIYFANIITKLGKKFQCRQRTIATTTVFFRRFYLKNSYCETDPFVVIGACFYLAGKAEESPLHIKSVVAECRSMFNHEHYGSRPFAGDNSKIAEMEFYLVDDLECDLVVFHPYRTLLSLCKKEQSSASEEGETEEMGYGIGADDAPRYWGTGEGQLEVPPAALQTAWSIINDTYRSQLCLLYPPHLIAIAAICLTFILHPPPRADDPAAPDSDSSPDRHPRRSSRQTAPARGAAPRKPQDAIGFLAELNVSLPTVATIAQEIIAMYTLWDQYKEDVAPEAGKGAGVSSNNAARELTHSPLPSGASASPTKRTPGSASDALFRGVMGTGSNSSGAPTPSAESRCDEGGGGLEEGSFVTPAFLSSVLFRMREARLLDMAPSTPSTGRPVAVNKRLERTQAAG